jgi:hypothetical protein
MVEREDDGAFGGSAAVMVTRRRKRVIRVAMVNFIVVACFLVVKIGVLEYSVMALETRFYFQKAP